MEFPEVQLYVDGRPMVASKNNPEIIDDWPLHSSHGLNTTLTVGACWQGNTHTRPLVNYITSLPLTLSLLLSCVQDRRAGCNTLCEDPWLAFPFSLGRRNLMRSLLVFTNAKRIWKHRPWSSSNLEWRSSTTMVTSSSTNSETWHVILFFYGLDLTELTLEGENKTNLEVLLRKVAYANLRDFPTPGRRPLRLYTNVVCSSGRTLKIPVLESAIVVQATPLPIVTVTGLSSSHYGYESLRSGVHLFPDARIEVSNADAAAAQDSSSEEDESSEEEDLMMNIVQRVDSCTATVYPPLNPDHETLTWPQNLLNQFKIEAKFSHDGITLMGSESTNHYEQVLHQLQYNNHKPAYYLTRAFKLICSQMSGRFVSNELVHTVSVAHVIPSL